MESYGSRDDIGAGGLTAAGSGSNLPDMQVQAHLQTVPGRQVDMLRDAEVLEAVDFQAWSMPGHGIML